MITLRIPGALRAGWSALLTVIGIGLIALARRRLAGRRSGLTLPVGLLPVGLACSVRLTAPVGLACVGLTTLVLRTLSGRSGPALAFLALTRVTW